MKKFLIIFLTVTSFQFAQFSSWEFWGNMKRPVAGGEIWEDFDNFYVFGGYSDSLQANVNWIQKFNIFDDTWELDSMSSPRFGLVAGNYNNSAYFFGGILDESNLITGIEFWNDTFVDEAIFNYDINFNRIFSTGQIVGDNFYIIGGNSLPGTSIDILPYIVEYNLAESSLSFQMDTLFSFGDLPEQQMSEVIGDDIFIFGGVINGISQDIYKFNTINHTYEKLPIELLEPRAGGRAVIASDQNRIYIIGGYNENSQALNSVEIFTAFGDDQYEIEESSPIQEARYNFMSASFDGQIYIMGGFGKENKVVKSIERLTEYAITDLNEEGSIEILNRYELYQNYPNPFNPTTTIKYSIPTLHDPVFSNGVGSNGIFVSLKVYNILGNEIATLVDQQQFPGVYDVEFNASNYPSTVYYYQLKINTPGRGNSFVQTKKMILLK